MERSARIKTNGAACLSNFLLSKVHVGSVWFYSRIRDFCFEAAGFLSPSPSCQLTRNSHLQGVHVLPSLSALCLLVLASPGTYFTAKAQPFIFTHVTTVKISASAMQCLPRCTSDSLRVGEGKGVAVWASVWQLTSLWLSLPVIHYFLPQNLVFQVIVVLSCIIGSLQGWWCLDVYFSCFLPLTQRDRMSKSSFILKRQGLHPWDFCFCALLIISVSDEHQIWITKRIMCVICPLIVI